LTDPWPASAQRSGPARWQSFSNCSATPSAGVFELIDLSPRITDRPGALTLETEEIRGEVALTDVTFRYGGGEGHAEPAADLALSDVSLRVAPGQLAALVGPSGAGKTTISYPVPRLYDVSEQSGDDRPPRCA
jgi:ATP-binding cassette, subfamily B, bacterial